MIDDFAGWVRIAIFDTCHHNFEFPRDRACRYAENSRRTSVHAFNEHPDPEGEANYIDKHKHVDTNYVSSGGWDRMTK